MKIRKLSNDITALDHSLDPLKERFNTDISLIRFLALLSSTCPMCCDQGALAVHENVFIKYFNADIRGYIVWINMLPKDSLEAALPAIKYLNDNRIRHFYDPNQRSGKAVAMSVGWDGKIAWDIYLFYPPKVKWTNIPPAPVS